MTGELPRVTGPAGVRWLDSFDAWAAREPGRVAIHPAGAAAITYGELAALAGRIASGIVAVTPESSPRVGVLSEDAAILAAGLLGALKASAVFVPLDPAHPRARLVSIVADTGPALMLADARNHRLGEWLAGADIPLLPFPPRPSATPAKDLPPAAGPDALAWILYTSSTSGRPKGVMQTRANVGTYATQVIDGLSLVSADRMLLASPLHVHAGATLSLAALRSGATLVPVDLRERGIERMATLIAAQAITLMFAVPTIFRALARWISTARVAPAVDFSGVRLLRLSGETVSGADLDDAWRIFPGLETVSVGLGTTETGGISHAYFHRGAAPLGRIPVGLPVDGVRVTLADGRGKPVPDGDTGEIVVTSATLSPGYWRDPALTAARFKAEPGARQYRTGDLGRRLPDGTLEHLGRKGFQVKINGQRVELAEIEAALRGLPGVADSAVRVVGRDERRTLAAYVVAQPGVVLLDAELRASLSAQLPRHMIPASYARLAALPVTRSGKVKARALRPPRADARPGVGGRAVSGLEAAICAIWDEVLALERAVGCDDDFIAVGGDSLQAVQILARVEAACGSRPSLSAFFDAATPARLAALIAKGG